MRRVTRLGATFLASAGLLAAAVPAVSGETTHTYPVTLTIEVDRSEHKVKGMIESEAPSTFCTESTVRVMKVEPGKDKKIASVFPGADNWGVRTSPKLKGSKVYAETSSYHLPSRPVVCLAARSHTVTAP